MLAANVSVCATAACRQLGAVMQSALMPNPSGIDPCANIYEYACGGWMAKHSVPAGQDHFDARSLIRQHIASDIQDILTGGYPARGRISTTLNPAQAAADRSNFDQLKRAFQVCMANTPALGLRDLGDVLNTIASLYPVGSKDNAAASLGRTLAFLAQAGIQPLVVFELPNPKGSTVHLVRGEAESRANDGSEAFKRIATDILTTIHPSHPSKDVALDLVRKITELEGRLRRVSYDTSPAVRTSLQRLNDITPHLNLSYVIRATFPPEYSLENIVMPEPFYFVNATRSILGDFAPETIRTFLMWKVIDRLAPWVGADVTNRLVDYEAKITDGAAKRKTSDAESCLEALETGPSWVRGAFASVLTWATNRFFLERSYPPEMRSITDAYIRRLKTTIIANIRSKSWLSEQAKSASDKHISAVRPLIGFPDYLLDPLLLANRSAPLKLTSSHVQNALALARADAHFTWYPLPPAMQGTGFLPESFLSSSAWYAPSANTVEVDAGMAQPPYFTPGAPEYANWGIYGTSLGHELTHVVESRAMPEWDDASKKALDARARCFDAQYSSMTVKARNGTLLPLQGSKERIENTGDQGGVRASFAAWKASRAEQNRAKGKGEGEEEPRLPGMEAFTNEQMFFLAWAQAWCEVGTPEYMEKTVSSSHPPSFARAQGSLANSREFRVAFNCPSKEPTCEVW